MENFQFFFQSQRTGGRPTGPDPENRVGGQDVGRPGRPVSSGLQVPGETGHCRATLLRLGVFPSKFSFSCTSRDE